MDKQNILITGGAGFIGTNLAQHLAKKGDKVIIFDNFSRPGTRENGRWLAQLDLDIDFIEADIRDQKKVEKAVKGVDIIYHLAAQVAVTTSVEDPRQDFEINACGTFNLLEAVRQADKKPVLVYASTNKVYGAMEEVVIEKRGKRYAYRDYPDGIPESFPLDFHSPYGCSKGAADQYVRDYNRIYGLPTVVFRQSCIYGPHQFGLEDQGWVAWFIIAAILGKPVTIYGDGCQVRDILFIDDLITAFEKVTDSIEVTAGEIYNVGGGPKNTLAIWSEFGPIIESLVGKKIKVSYDQWRPGDQKIYVSNINKIKRDIGWQPKVGVKQGIRKLFKWVKENKEMLEKYF